VKPRVFIGSSVEGKALAEAIQVNLDYDLYCTIWTQAVFGVGSSTLDDLLQAVRTNDFAIFVLSPDDDLTLRGALFKVARDNVLFEAGMFVGRYGKGKVFLVTPRGLRDFHLPTDLSGITMADYDPQRLKSDSAQATLGSACTKIKDAIKVVPNNANDLLVQASHLTGPTSGPGKWNIPSKLSMDITNKSKCPVVLKPVCFRYHPDLKPAPNAPALGSSSDNRFAFQFRASDFMHTLDSVFIRPGESANTYAGIDPAMSGGDVQKAISAKHLGELHLECYWMDNNPRIQYCVVLL
jgi:hypothetical protein